jgi:hypothetical protein
MSEATSIKSQVFVPGKKKGGGLKRLLTLETISNWIRLQRFDEYTTNGLIEMASKYPTQALPSFRRNFNLMIERVRVKRRAELQGQAQPQPEVKPIQAQELKENNASQEDEGLRPNRG